MSAEQKREGGSSTGAHTPGPRNFKVEIDEHGCKPSHGCHPHFCVCALAEDAAEEVERLRSLNADMLAALHQASTVCADNAPASCNHQLALDFVRQVVDAAIAAAVGDRPEAAQPQNQREGETS